MAAGREAGIRRASRSREWAARTRTGGAFRAAPVPPSHHHGPPRRSRAELAHLRGDYRAKASASRGYGWSICPSFAECLYTSQEQQPLPSADFQHDALNGHLPAFSVVTPGGPSFTHSCHNSMSITACDNWAGSLMSAVENGPDWDRTAVFITWDDCGCFYDQVPPPAG